MGTWLILLAVGTAFVVAGSLLSFGVVLVVAVPHGEFGVLTRTFTSIYIGRELSDRRPLS